MLHNSVSEADVATNGYFCARFRIVLRNKVVKDWVVLI